MELLPEEMIVQMCGNLSLSDLAKLSRSSSRMFRICNDVISRREEYKLRQKKIQFFKDRIFKMALRKEDTVVTFDYYKNKLNKMKQLGPLQSTEIWPLHEIRFEQSTYLTIVGKYYFRREAEIPASMIDKLATNLVDYGYTYQGVTNCH